jgi:hypothetical protein
LPKKVRTAEEHLETIENLLVGILLKRQPTVRELAKIIGVSTDRITQMYPKRKGEEEAEELESKETSQSANQQGSDETPI